MSIATSNKPGLVVIGGGQAAAQLIDVARQQGYREPITLVSEEGSLPYQRPPLSKQYLAGLHGEDWLLYRSPNFYADTDVSLKLGTQVVAIDRSNKRVVLADGEALPYTKLALTTGARSKPLDVAGAAHPGIFYIRNLADVNRLKAELAGLKRILIVGAGFIGLEAAAILVKQGMSVRVLSNRSEILPRLGCSQLSEFLLFYHLQHGVEFHFNSELKAIEPTPEGLNAIDQTGAAYHCDAIIAGIGAIPNTELAREAGLDCDNGIMVDEHAVTSDPDILAAGDCTNHPNHHYQMRLRLETVHNAVEQGRTAGCTLAGVPEPYRQIPWVWSDQYRLRIQSVGILDGHTRTVVRGNKGEGKFALFYFRNDRLLAGNMVNEPHLFAATRRILNEGLILTPEQAANPAIDLTRLPSAPGRLQFDVPWATRAERGLVKNWGHS